MEFKAELKTEDIDLYTLKDWEVLNNTDENDFIDIESEFEIVWGLDMDVRNWGVKDLNITIKSIKGEILVADMGSDDEKEVRLEFDNSKENFEIVSENLLMSDENHNPLSSIFISGIEIDFSSKKITLI
jgi:hypothetical protein